MTDFLLMPFLGQAVWLWLVFVTVVVALLAFDLGVLHKDDHAIGISRGGATSKIHLIVDACGNPLEVIITAGNVNDVSIAPELIAAVDLAETEVNL